MARPIIRALDKVVSLNASIAASELFEVVSFTDPITHYFFQDFRTTPTTGYFTLDGVPQVQGALLTVAAADLGKLRYVGGSNISFEKFRVYARDSAGRFGDIAVTARMFTARANTTIPFAKANSFSVVGNESVAGPNIISGFDPDGHPILHFRIRDLTLDKGYFILNGVGQTQTGWFTVNEADLGKLQYYSNGTISGPTSTEQIEVQSFDGVHYSTVSRGTVTSIINASRPVVRFVSTETESNPAFGTPFAVVSRADVFDADQNTMKKFRFLNSSPHANHGELMFNGVAVPRQTWFEVSQADFGKLMFVPKNFNSTQSLRYMAFDGRHWSTGINIMEIKTKVVPNPFIIPDIQPVREELYGIQRTDHSVMDMFVKRDLGNPYIEYEVLDVRVNQSNDLELKTGNFRIGTTNIPSGVVRNLTLAQFNQLNYWSGSADLQGRESLYVRAKNVSAWGAWSKVDFNTHPEIENALEGGTSWLAAPMGQFIPRDNQGRPILTYSFMDSFPDYETGEAVDDDPPAHFATFNQQQQIHARMVMNHLEAITNLRIVEVPDSSTNVFGQRGGIFRFGEYGVDGSDAAAFAFFPSMAPQGGDSWYNRLTMDTRFLPGTRAFTTILHELGHALGLKHPHEDLPAVLHTALDSSDRSVMSYNSPVFRNPTSYQLYDLHHLQNLYGANDNHNNGDDLYNIRRFQSRDGAYLIPEFQDLVFETIWDGGGKDTLSAEGAEFGATVDLRQGMPSSIGSSWDEFAFNFFGEFVAVPAEDNIRIAIGTDIENGTGSAHNDRIIGNHLSNVLRGEAGDDYLFGGKGTDYLFGGIGNDTYEFGVADGFNSITEEGGNTDKLVISPFPGLTQLSDDVVFRRIANDLVVDLRLNRGLSQGVARITNQFLGGANSVETLELNGVRIDLMNLTPQVTGVNVNNRFTLQANFNTNGFLVSPVV